MSAITEVLVGVLVLVLSLALVLVFVFICWGIIWKLLLSRLGLFRELFNGLSGKNTKENDKQTGYLEKAKRRYPSASSSRQRSKDAGSSVRNRSVVFDSTKSYTTDFELSKQSQTSLEGVSRSSQVDKTYVNLT